MRSTIGYYRQPRDSPAVELNCVFHFAHLLIFVPVLIAIYTVNKDASFLSTKYLPITPTKDL